MCRNSVKQADNEIVYETHLNGAQRNGDTLRAPPWPESQDENEIMFLLPRILNDRDTININGVLKRNPQNLYVSLITGNTSPDYQNIACQFEAIFPSDTNNEDKVVIKVVQNGDVEVVNGYDSVAATDIFSESNFTFTFTLRVANSNGGDIQAMDIYVGGSFVHQMQMKHNLNNVRFLTLHGDIYKVEKLDFEFS